MAAGGIVRSLRAVRDNACAVLALGFAWSWTNLSFFSVSLLVLSNQAAEDGEMYHYLSMLGMVGMALTVPFLRRGATGNYRNMMAVACVLSVASTLVGAFGTALGVVVFAAAALVGGVGSIMMAYCILWRLSRCGGLEHVLVMLAAALLFCTCYYALAGALGQMVSFALALVSPLAAGACFRRSVEGCEDVGEERDDILGALRECQFPWKMVVGFAAFGLMFGMVRFLMPGDEAGAAAFLFDNNLARGLGGALVAVVSLCSRDRNWMTSVAGIACWALAFLASYGETPTWMAATMWFSVMGYTCFDLLMFAITIDMASSAKVPYKVVFSICSSSMLLATMLGNTLSAALASGALGERSVDVLQCSIFGVVVLALVLFDARQVSGLWSLKLESIERDGVTDQGLSEVLSRRFGLSPRECEVALLLTQGRNEPYIADTLLLSRSTVHTHVLNAYAKLGAHSRQEFLTRIECEVEGMNRRGL